jgi:hypothetical protein
MILGRRAFAALPLAMAAGEAAAQSTWYAVRGPDHSFIVDMPGEPVYKVIDTRSAGGKWTSVDWRDVQGAPAAESTGSVQGGSVMRQLVVLKGRRYVSLAYLAPADSLRTPEADRFFKSLRLGA